MIAPRAGHTATLLPDGKVLVAGGYGLAGKDYHRVLPVSAELYDPISGSWTATAHMITPRLSHTATLLGNGKVLVAGGSGNDGFAAAAELYDPVSGSWTATGTMITPRQSHTATLLSDGKVLVVGGYGGTKGLPLASAELYDPSTGSWTATGHMTRVRAGQTATLLPDGKVLVAGGAVYGPGSPPPAATAAELYDPSTGSWTATGSMLAARTGHAATLLADGRVLVTGGARLIGPSSAFASAEVYDTGTGTWTATGSMVAARIGHTATLLSDGRVFVAGGGSSPSPTGALATAELYDPGSGTWTAAGSMSRAREGQAATLLLDGRVLITGGLGGSPKDLRTYQSASVPTAAAELYDAGGGTP